MLQTLKLILPAIIPSWRFFDTIAPSPRIEFALLETLQGSESTIPWREFRPRPQSLSISNMLGRMFWNPRWNESLFLVSCAERIMENPTEHSIQEILNRIKNDLQKDSSVYTIITPYLQFRLVFISRQGLEIQREISYISQVFSFSESASP